MKKAIQISDNMPSGEDFFISGHIIETNDCAYTDEGVLVSVRKDINYFTFPDCIKVIGENAFDGCHNLRNLTLPETITEIPNNLGICFHLEWVYLPKSIVSITPGTLIMNYGQEKHPTAHYPKIYVPEGFYYHFLSLDGNLDEIGLVETKNIMTASSLLPDENNKHADERYEDRYIFYSGAYANDTRMIRFGENYLGEYEIKEGTEVICDECFNDLFCEIDGFYLRKLTIPKSVQVIGENAFCPSLEEIDCRSPYFKIEDNALLSSDGTIFYRYLGTEEDYCVPNNVKRIVGGAFSGKEMNSVSLPSSVQTIGDNPVADAKLFINNDFIYCQILCQSSLFLCSENDLIDKSTGKLISYFGRNNDLYVVKECVKIIGPKAFWGATIKKMIIPYDIEEMDETAFYYSSFDEILVPLEKMSKYEQILPKFIKDVLKPF